MLCLTCIASFLNLLFEKAEVYTNPVSYLLYYNIETIYLNLFRTLMLELNYRLKHQPIDAFIVTH